MWSSFTVDQLVLFQSPESIKLNYNPCLLVSGELNIYHSTFFFLCFPSFIPSPGVNQGFLGLVQHGVGPVTSCLLKLCTSGKTISIFLNL